MPVKTKLWTVGEMPQIIGESHLVSEQQLEEMIVGEPRLLSDEWMIIGRQEHTGQGGIIDLLAIAPDGSLILIELKRNKTPRDVVAQAIDYASWVEGLHPEELATMYRRFSSGGDLVTDFSSKFGQNLDEDQFNQSHQIIIVAAELDSSTERIVKYLNDRDIAINVLFFQVFSSEPTQILSRTWLLDPVETQSAATHSKKRDSEPWNGEFYCSFVDSTARSWQEAVEYGFICGGGGAWYSRTLQYLEPGDRVWVKVPGKGFVGVCRVLQPACSAADFKIKTEDGEMPALNLLKLGSYHREFVNDEERCEYFVSVQWLETRPIENALQEIGMFGNQNTICKPTKQKWRTTIDRLKQHFTKYDELIS